MPKTPTYRARSRFSVGGRGGARAVPGWIRGLPTVLAGGEGAAARELRPAHATPTASAAWNNLTNFCHIDNHIERFTHLIRHALTPPAVYMWAGPRTNIDSSISHLDEDSS